MVRLYYTVRVGFAARGRAAGRAARPCRAAPIFLRLSIRILTNFFRRSLRGMGCRVIVSSIS